MLNLTRVGLWLLVGRIVFKFIINLRLYIPPNRMAEAIRLVSTNNGRTIRKVMGGRGWGNKQKKIHARENAKK